MSNNSTENKRIEFPQRIKDITRMNVGGICCLCQNYAQYGEVAHIISASIDGGGPRSAEEYHTEKYPSDPENAIWLCKSCHTKVDKHEVVFTQNQLVQKKVAQERDWKDKVQSVLNNKYDDKFWRDYNFNRMIILYLFNNINYCLKYISEFVQFIDKDYPYTFDEFNEIIKKVNKYLSTLITYIESEFFIKYLKKLGFEKIIIKLVKYCYYIFPAIDNYLTFYNLRELFSYEAKLDCCEKCSDTILDNKCDILKIQGTLIDFFYSEYKKLLKELKDE